MWKQTAAQVIPIVISSTGVNPKSLSQSLTTLKLNPNTYIQLQKIRNSWHMFNCKKLFKPQIRPLSLILLITTSQDRWIFPSQSWEVRNSMIIIIISLYLLRITVDEIFSVYQIACIFNAKEKRFAYTVRRLLQTETDAEKCYFSWRLLLEGQIWGTPSTHSYSTGNCYVY